MSRDSMVTSLPSHGWSCDTLEGGVKAAAALSGLNLQPADLEQVAKCVMEVMQKKNQAAAQNLVVVKKEPASPKTAPTPPPVQAPASSTMPSPMHQMMASPTADTVPGEIQSPKPTPSERAVNPPASFELISTQVAADMVEVEKKKNLDLLNRIAELEARCQAKQQDAEEKKSSNLEQLLQKTLSRVTELENQVKSVGEKPPEPKPVEKVVPTPAPASEAEEPDESCDEGAESDDEGITTPSGQNVKISTDALRMRTRRLCEKKPSGRCAVDPSVAQQYKEGGEAREVLEMALLECLAKHGIGRHAYKKIKSDFQQKCKLIRERLESRECETHGKWMTEDAMKRSGLFSASAMKHIIAYCKRFPESLVRPWQYNEQINEYYVIVDDTTLLKKSDTTIHTEETDLGDKFLKKPPSGLPDNHVNIPDPVPGPEVVGSKPVADLESYMQSLERKQQSVEKMVKSLQGQTDDGAKKLHASLTPLATRMSESYSKFSAHITELKMDHREGKLPSDRLTELLKDIAEEKNDVRKQCTTLIPLEARFRQLAKDLKLDSAKNTKGSKKGKGRPGGKAKGRANTEKTTSKSKKTKKPKGSGSKTQAENPPSHSQPSAPAKAKKKPRRA